MIWCFRLFRLFLFGWLDFNARENNNKLRDKALKFYLIFVYLLLCSALLSRSSSRFGHEKWNTSLTSTRFLILKKVFWLKMEEQTVMVRNETIIFEFYEFCAIFYCQHQTKFHNPHLHFFTSSKLLFFSLTLVRLLSKLDLGKSCVAIVSAQLTFLLPPLHPPTLEKIENFSTLNELAIKQKLNRGKSFSEEICEILICIIEWRLKVKSRKKSCTNKAIIF